MTSRLPRYEAKCVQCRCFQCGSVPLPLCVQISRERSYPLPICWYHSKSNWLRYNLAAESFYIMKLWSRLSSFIVQIVQKTTNLGNLSPILRKLGRRRTLLMARWKARVEFLLSVLNFFFHVLRLRRYKAKCVKTRCYQEGIGQFEPRFQREGVVPVE